MRIEIALVPANADAAAPEGQPARVEFLYDEVLIRSGDGQRQIESAERFAGRPYLERYMIVRDGRALFIRQGKPLDLAEMLRRVRSGSEAGPRSGQPSQAAAAGRTEPQGVPAPPALQNPSSLRAPLNLDPHQPSPKPLGAGALSINIPAS